jgi:hypothetical protein
MKNKRKLNNKNKGGISFEMEVLIFIVIIFIIWVFTGGSRHQEAQKPFIKPLTDPNNPGQVYGPEDLKN